MSVNNLGFGAYYPINSPIHRLDPRIKIIATILLMSVIFSTDEPWIYVLMGGILLVIMPIGKITLICLKRLRSIWLLLLVMTSISMLLIEGRPLFINHPFLPITYEGFVVGVQMTSRLILVLLISSILTLTTSPFLLTEALEKMLKPVKKMGVIVSITAMIIQLSLRFIPTFTSERDKIMKAQAARGYTVDKNIIAQSKGMLVLVVPLLFTAFRRVEELAAGMDARGFVVGRARTSVREIRMMVIDYVVLIGVVMFVGWLLWVG